MADTMECITLARRPNGLPVPEDFALETRPMPEPADGEVLIEVSHLSLDPYMRGRMDDVKSYAPSVDIGGVMTGQGVGRVVASCSDAFDEGDRVIAVTGWASHAVLPADQVRKVGEEVAPSLHLGVLGMPGFTAWAGMREYGRPAEGQTLVVAAATGPVGSMVGQIASAAGMRTIAIAGGADKCRIAQNTFGFDAALDHRAYDTASDLRKALAQAAPDGIDIYWENVGGKVLEAVIPLMNVHGRIPVCGTIAWYSGADGDKDRLPMVWRAILTKRLSVNGMIIFDHYDKFDDFAAEMTPKVVAGEIAWLEDVAEGLANAPAAFISMLGGGNTGKQIVAL